ncbi:Transcriptional regulator HilA [Paraburkholderia aspalathi]|uniref:Transcriptional regulator HilA n=1 Tax=Paraburkholderia aspalathi TaxID=1324617 RepID=A0ABN7NCR4_9BURK|nr:winged helix-turn-helix domain-containing protein [Paraburkholderia aspalathi]MBK3823637.1 tetratricopeptide repeat protein [Paraburkholderia aspalathi]MBK3835472.1 tetratricopeptide repeat protein [Paraburkholderia aspalathi]MBK3865245.1 tetratricopeptide repeat protein [Paraburkholderia aspalathi]CAE6854265.1 Transcriptional regulator HilA [Paraburkholderia aspalathi]
MNPQEFVRIGDTELDIQRYELRRAGQQIPLERLPMELLILMASRDGQLVTRADIVRALWGGNAFRETDNSINTAIRKIRIALDENPDHPLHLTTVKGKGYRLNGTRTFSEEPLQIPAEAVRVLVLPFENNTGDSSEDSLCDALADETSANIGVLNPERILVIARTTAARYRRVNKSIAEIAHELSVDYVLEGSLTRDGGRVRILAHLIRCVDQVQIWSRAHEPMTRGALDIQKEVGTALAQEVSPALAQQQQHMLARRLPVDPMAHDAYLRGRYYWTRRVHFDAGFAAHHALNDEDFIRARSYFESAVDRDPTYALGYVGLSNIFGSTATHGFYAPSHGYPKARESALRALALDASLPEAHQALAGVHYFYDWDWQRAEAEFLKALRLNPSHAETSRLYGRLLLVLGREAEGRAQFELAESVDPLGFEGSRVFGLIQSGRYEEVIREYLNSGHGNRSPLIYQLLATAFEVQGLYEEAIEATVDALTRCNEFARAACIRAIWDSGGYQKVLQWYLQDLQTRSRKRYTSPLLFAELYARLAQADEMFHWLEVAVAERSPRLCELRTNPWFQHYRSTGRFRKVEKQVGY